MVNMCLNSKHRDWNTVVIMPWQPLTVGESNTTKENSLRFVMLRETVKILRVTIGRIKKENKTAYLAKGEMKFNPWRNLDLVSLLPRQAGRGRAPPRRQGPPQSTAFPEQDLGAPVGDTTYRSHCLFFFC